MDNFHVSGYSSSQCYSFEFKHAVEILSITAVALTAIGSLTVGILVHHGVLSGINTIYQGALILTGVGLATLAIALGTFRIGRIQESIIDIENLTLEELEALIHTIAEKEKDPIKKIDKIARAIPLEKLQALVKKKYPQVDDAAREARKMVNQAHIYLAAEEKFSPTLRTKLLSSMERAYLLLDSLFISTDMEKFFSDLHPEWQGTGKFSKFYILFGILATIIAVSLSFTGPSVDIDVLIAGSITLGLLAVYIFWPKLRHLFCRIQEGDNWTKRAREGKLETFDKRPEAISRIAEALSQREHPLLTAPSGGGNAQTVKAFVHALENGEFPELHGKTVIYFNMADIVDRMVVAGNGVRILEKIREQFEADRDKYIIIFDEVHLAFQKPQSSELEQKLKTLLSDVERGLPHFIALTSEEAYHTHIRENLSVDRLFRNIKISSTSKDTTEVILHQYLIKHFPDAIVDKLAFQHLYEKTSQSPQPLTAMKVLSKCVHRTSHPQDPSKAAKLEELQNQWRNNNYRQAMQGSPSLATLSESVEKGIELGQAMRALEIELEKEDAGFRNLAHAKKCLSQARKAKFRQIIKAAKNKNLTKFLLLTYFLEESLEAKIQSQAKELGTSAVIDSDLIDEVWQSESRP